MRGMLKLVVPFYLPLFYIYKLYVKKNEWSYTLGKTINTTSYALGFWTAREICWVKLKMEKHTNEIWTYNVKLAYSPRLWKWITLYFGQHEDVSNKPVVLSYEESTYSKNGQSAPLEICTNQSLNK